MKLTENFSKSRNRHTQFPHGHTHTHAQIPLWPHHIGRRQWNRNEPYKWLSNVCLSFRWCVLAAVHCEVQNKMNQQRSSTRTYTTQRTHSHTHHTHTRARASDRSHAHVWQRWQRKLLFSLIFFFFLFQLCFLGGFAHLTCVRVSAV